jgi:membrane-bound ClpP family serine protease
MNRAITRGKAMQTTFSPTTQWFAKLAHGQVEKAITLAQPGQVRFQGSFWKAELASSSCRAVQPGERVKVVGRCGIRLLVVPNEYVLPRQDEPTIDQGHKSPLAHWTRKVGATFAGVVGVAIG